MANTARIEAKLDRLIQAIGAVEGRVGTLTALHSNTEKQVSKLEGRMWGLMVGVLGAGASSLLSLIMANASHPNVISAASAWLAAFI